MSKSTGLENFKRQFKENKQLKNSTIAIATVLVLILGYIVYRQFIFGPKEEKSKTAYFKGLNLAAKDSTDAAITELTAVVKKYDGTKGGEIAQFTLARQYMTKGNFKKAIELLEDVDVSDTYVAARVVGLQGDCKSELGAFADAVKLYEEAAAVNENEYTSPEYLFKAALVSELELKDFAKALELYEKVRDNYGTFSSQKTIEKYIARVSNKTIK